MAEPEPPRYPVAVDVDPQLGARNRLTVFFRLILAIPHAILVGVPGFGLAIHSQVAPTGEGPARTTTSLSGNGLIGAVAAFCAVISWFVIVFTGRQPRGLWNLTHFYMRWRVNAVAYIALLRDEYPPFGEGPYPVEYAVEYPERRNRLTVALRLLLVIPHAIVLTILDIVWFFSTVVAWLAILVTGDLPQGLARFGAGMMRWTVRVETYMLLMRDEYPPFSLHD